MAAMSLSGALLLGWLIAMSPKKRPAAVGGAAGGDAGSPEGERKPKAAKSQAKPPPAAAKGPPADAPPASNADEAAAEADAEGQAGADGGVRLEAGSPRKRAPKGARDQVAPNRMLTGLRQQKSGKDPEEAAKAAAALEMHLKLGWEEKESMVERCRGNKTRGSMKWIDDWMETRNKDDATAAGWNEKWRGLGQALQLLGLNLSDSETREEARAFVIEEVHRNQVDSGTLESHPPKIDESNWLMSRYFWVVDQGKTRAVAPAITGKHTAQLESRANDCKQAIQSGWLEFSMGARGGDEVQREGDGAEALEAAKHAAKFLRASRRKVDRPLKSLTVPDVDKYAEAGTDLDKVCDALNLYQEDQEKVINKLKGKCEARAKQRDERRKAGDEHAKNAATKVTEMQGKLMRDPSEWS
ncbi:unnamed protein product [Prorocentrum cordatum]|uniref:Uncharacterized protein n=1 Tax=Prorocentrum cordatum TaxID=2364126 RepID=A0ABN9Y5G9_9DINO|nr:unnamed protein product [Polarella glacialis]